MNAFGPIHRSAGKKISQRPPPSLKAGLRDALIHHSSRDKRVMLPFRETAAGLHPSLKMKACSKRRLDPFPKPNTIPNGWDLSAPYNL